MSGRSRRETSRAKQIDYMNRHADLVRELESRVRDRYSMTATEVDVRDPETGRVVGEIDLLGIIANEMHLYEVKVNDNPEKAVDQLTNLRNYLKGCGNISLFYYSGKKDAITKIG